ncbi:MAG: NAD-dependent epimerase/dehydratase family protein [Oligoflexia bacterium]|nr:NAD-dependent epimerase/dehydratase family protein [Oligoflexia bacterium]
MKVLVTGATGFVGSHLADELFRQGHEVSILVRSTSSLLNIENAEKMERILGSLSDLNSLKEAVKGKDVVFHLAGVVSAKNREEYFTANVDGLKKLLDVCKTENPSVKFILVSSLAAAGPSTKDQPRKENEASSPVSFYGESKLAGESLALQEVERMKLAIIRPPAVYGPKDTGVFSFFQIINKGVMPLIGKDKKYSFVHVDDLVSGLILLMNKMDTLSSGEVFYLSEEKTYQWEEAMQLIARSLEKKVIRFNLPIFALYFAGFLGTLASKASKKAPPLTLDKVKEITAPSWTCSNQKAKKILGYEPRWSLSNGFEQTAAWYRENGWL